MAGVALRTLFIICDFVHYKLSLIDYRDCSGGFGNTVRCDLGILGIKKKLRSNVGNQL